MTTTIKTNGTSSTTTIEATGKSIRNTAILSVVNKAIGDKTFPANFRGPLMSDLYKAGQVQQYKGVVAKHGEVQTRWVMPLGTVLTPYTPSDKPRAKARDEKFLVKGVCLTRYVENMAKLFEENLVNPIKGVTEDQREHITRKSFRTFKLRTVEDSVTE